MIEFACPHCTKQFRVKDDSAAGRTGTCPHCGGSVTIPGKASETEPQQTSPPMPPDPIAFRFIFPVAAAPIILGMLAWLGLQAEELAKSPAPYFHTNRFQTDYAASATANAVESIESQAAWFVRYGNESVQFWLIVIAALLVLLFGLVLVQTERLIAAIRRP